MAGENILEDPCSEEFDVEYYGIYDEFFLLKDEVGYYPTFSYEGDKYCTSEVGDAHAYIITSPGLWKTRSMAECCYKFYQW